MRRTCTLTLASLAGLCFISAGCPSIQSVQTAMTVGEGNYEVGIEPGTFGVAAQGGGVFVLAANVSARFGVSDKVDIGGRFGTSLLEVHGKFMFTDPQDEQAIQAAFAPQLGGLFLGGGGSGGGYFWLTAPVLVDVPVKRSAFVFGPRTQIIGVVASGGGEGGGGLILNVGSSVGFAGRVSDNVRLLPEFSAVVPVVAGVSTTGGGGADFIGGGMLYTFTFGILIGGR